jgi:RNA polymerase sigma-70 factor (ECF subfamily)
MPACAAAREVAHPIWLAESEKAKVPDFDTLYDQYADFVWRNASRLGISGAALEDVMQDVFLVAHLRLNELVKPEALRAWMFSIVIRVVRDYRRKLRRKDPGKRSRSPILDPDQLPEEASTRNPYASAEQRDAVRLLHRILGELDDAKREVFVLAELEEMTEPEIAMALGDNINTIHSRLRAARKQFNEAVFRHRLRDEWRLR